MNKTLTDQTILVVDDEMDNLIVISHVLMFYGATVHTARDGVEALEQLKKISLPDLIISDISMPHMDGWILLSAIREIYENIPVIAVTAHAMPGYKERVMAAGFTDYISKPIDVKEFAPKIAKLIITQNMDKALA